VRVRVQESVTYLISDINIRLPIFLNPFNARILVSRDLGRYAGLEFVTSMPRWNNFHRTAIKEKKDIFGRSRRAGSSAPNISRISHIWGEALAKFSRNLAQRGAKPLRNFLKLSHEIVFSSPPPPFLTGNVRATLSRDTSLESSLDAVLQMEGEELEAAYRRALECESDGFVAKGPSTLSKLSGPQLDTRCDPLPPPMGAIIQLLDSVCDVPDGPTMLRGKVTKVVVAQTPEHTSYFEVELQISPRLAKLEISKRMAILNEPKRELAFDFEWVPTFQKWKSDGRNRAPGSELRMPVCAMALPRGLADFERVQVIRGTDNKHGGKAALYAFYACAGGSAMWGAPCRMVEGGLKVMWAEMVSAHSSPQFFEGGPPEHQRVEGALHELVRMGRRLSRRACWHPATRSTRTRSTRIVEWASRHWQRLAPSRRATCGESSSSRLERRCPPRRRPSSRSRSSGTRRNA
jgi:hypothetical protein